MYNIAYMEYHPNAADNGLLVRDMNTGANRGNGNVLWQIKAPIGAPHHEAEGILVKEINRKGIQGINVETLDGGVLYIHLY